MDTPIRKRSFADKLADLFVDRDGNGSWTAIVMVLLLIAVFIYTANWIDDKLTTRYYESEKAEIIDRANANAASLKVQLVQLESDIKARDKEVIWARNREEHHVKERAKLEAENAELTTLLNSRYPADLLR